MCWFHMKKAYEGSDSQSKSPFKAIDKDNKARLRYDISILQLSESKEIFDKGFQLFKKKWNDLKDNTINQFLQYFEKEWYTKHPGWYEGFAPGLPSTNNGLESTNGVIKKDGTTRKRLSLARFLELVESKIVKDWSINRNPEKPISPILFDEVPPISHELWLKTYNTTQREMTAVMSKNKEKIHYMASGRTIATNFKADLKEYRRLKDKLNWTDFDSFKDMQSRFWELCLMEDKDNWTFSTCNCREFQKNYI